MNADALALVLVCLASVPATLNPLIYAFRPWWTTDTGRSLMTSWVGLGLLVDISLLYMLFGDNYPGRDLVRLSVYVLIVAGLWLSLAALCRTIWRAYKPKPPEGY